MNSTAPTARDRYRARQAAAQRGEPPPEWAAERRGGRPRRTVIERDTPPAPAVALDIPDWARRWRAGKGPGACVRVTPAGTELSYFDERAAQRVAAFIAHDRFTTENAAAYALAQGGIRFAPLSRGAVRDACQSDERSNAF
jgi:hypothetical protein